jgi:hypothetical protein
VPTADGRGVTAAAGLAAALGKSSYAYYNQQPYKYSHFQ